MAAESDRIITISPVVYAELIAEAEERGAARVRERVEAACLQLDRYYTRNGYPSRTIRAALGGDA